MGPVLRFIDAKRAVPLPRNAKQPINQPVQQPVPGKMPLWHDDKTAVGHQHPMHCRQCLGCHNVFGGEGGENGVKNGRFKRQLLHFCPRQIGWLSILAQPLPGLPPHLRRQINPEDLKLSVVQRCQHMPRPVTNFQHRRSLHKGQGRLLPAPPFTQRYQPAYQIVRPGHFIIQKAEAQPHQKNP